MFKNRFRIESITLFKLKLIFLNPRLVVIAWRAELTVMEPVCLLWLFLS